MPSELGRNVFRKPVFNRQSACCSHVSDEIQKLSKTAVFNVHGKSGRASIRKAGGGTSLLRGGLLLPHPIVGSSYVIFASSSVELLSLNHLQNQVLLLKPGTKSVGGTKPRYYHTLSYILLLFSLTETNSFR